MTSDDNNNAGITATTSFSSLSATGALHSQQQQQPASTTTTMPSSSTLVRRRTSRLSQTWQDFHRALRSVREPFNPFVWIWRLVVAVLDHVYVSMGLADVVERRGGHNAKRLQLGRRYFRACIPILAMCLIVLVILSYPLSMRHKLIQPRWCSTTSSASSASSSLTLSSCYWIYLHDSIVFYLGFMILYHYISTIFSSPGVALPSLPLSSSSESSTATTPKWTAANSQGGILGWNAVCNVAQERQRVQLYGPLSMVTTTVSTTSSDTTAIAAISEQKKKKSSSSNNIKNNNNNNNNNNNKSHPSDEEVDFYFPSGQASYCEKCQIIRPPRCHHCSVCRRCVLQYDHHCIWVNSCIGYNNYRHFVLLLMFLMLGCWYGVGMLLLPFYEPLREQIRQHGLHWLYSNGTGLLDLPTPTKLLHMMFWSDDGLPVKIVVDLVYPLLLGVGAILSGFLGFHVQYMLKARTTLEHKIILQDALVNIFHQGQQQLHQRFPSTPTPPNNAPVPTPSVSNATNPFDQGYYKNLQQILGPNLLLIFLPVSISPPAPYLPGRTNTGTRDNATTSRSRKEC